MDATKWIWWFFSYHSPATSSTHNSASWAFPLIRKTRLRNLGKLGVGSSIKPPMRWKSGQYIGISSVKKNHQLWILLQVGSKKICKKQFHHVFTCFLALAWSTSLFSVLLSRTFGYCRDATHNQLENIFKNIYLHEISQTNWLAQSSWLLSANDMYRFHDPRTQRSDDPEETGRDASLRSSILPGPAGSLW